MIPTILVNDITIVHKDSDGVATCSAPDFCKTPGAGVVPYVNIAFSKDLVKGSRTVTTDKVPAAMKESMFKPSYGNEPGVGGGVNSGVNMGWAKFSNYSQNVFIESRNVARLSDPMIMNGNSPNTQTVAELQGNIGPDHILCKIFCWCNDGNNGGDFIKKEKMDIPPSGPFGGPLIA